MDLSQFLYGSRGIQIDTFFDKKLPNKAKNSRSLDNAGLDNTVTLLLANYCVCLNQDLFKSPNTYHLTMYVKCFNMLLYCANHF